MDNEEKYKEDLRKEGVELPELEVKTEDPEDKNKKDPKDPEEPENPVKEPEKKAEETEGDDKKEPDDKNPNLKTKNPDEPRKPRSIYDDLKNKKIEARTEKERADIAEAKVVELQDKIDAIVNKANDGKTTKTEEKDALAYIEENGLEADPELIKHIIADARKGIPTDYEALKKDIEEIKATNQKTIEENRKILEQQNFEEEFTAVLPTIKEFFPTASPEEIKTIKKELDTISHQKDWHDKDLDYILFKKKDSLSAFVTPKKRGMESRDKKDIEDNTFEFDPNADLSKMTQEQRDKWETEYLKAGKSEGLLEGKDGKKLML